MEGEFSKSRLVSFVGKMNGSDITAVEEFCIMDCKPIITCKYTNFISYVYFVLRSYKKLRSEIARNVKRDIITTLL